MFQVDEVTGNITLKQGDSGTYTLTDIEREYAFTPYLSVSTQDRIIVGEELIGEVEGNTITFKFKPSFTDLLEVKKGQEDATYIFDVKITSGIDDIEDTLVIGNKGIYDLNTITVLPKIAEGTKIE